MPSRNTYCLTWVSLTLDVQYLFTAAPAKCSCSSLPWTRGISLCPSWPWKWSSSCRLPCNCGAAAPWMGRGVGGVAPLGRRPWPWAWGSSSRLLLGHRRLALSIATPDVRWGVAPLSRVSARSVTTGALNTLDCVNLVFSSVSLEEGIGMFKLDLLKRNKIQSSQHRHWDRGRQSPSIASAAAAKSLQLCPTLCDPLDGSPPGSPVPGTLQARALEWVVISFPSVWKWKWSRPVVSDS